MERIVKKFPVFVWLSEEPLSGPELAEPYQLGIEFFHAKTSQELKEFMREEFLDDVIVVTNSSMAEEAFFKVHYWIVKKIYVLCHSEEEVEEINFMPARMKIFSLI